MKFAGGNHYIFSTIGKGTR